MNSRLTDPEFDAALLNESDTILPSSGFADSVMAAVREQASAPPPIPFPWKRALPGFAAAVLAIGALVATLVSTLLATLHAGLDTGLSPAARTATLSPAVGIRQAGMLAAALQRFGGTDAFWLIFAFLITAACLAFCRQLSAPQ